MGVVPREWEAQILPGHPAAECGLEPILHDACTQPAHDDPGRLEQCEADDGRGGYGEGAGGYTAITEGGEHHLVGDHAEHPGGADGGHAVDCAADRSAGEDPRLLADGQPEDPQSLAQDRAVHPLFHRYLLLTAPQPATITHLPVTCIPAGRNLPPGNVSKIRGSGEVGSFTLAQLTFTTAEATKSKTGQLKARSAGRMGPGSQISARLPLRLRLERCDPLSSAPARLLPPRGLFRLQDLLRTRPPMCPRDRYRHSSSCVSSASNRSFALCGRRATLDRNALACVVECLEDPLPEEEDDGHDDSSHGCNE